MFGLWLVRACQRLHRAGNGLLAPQLILPPTFLHIITLKNKIVIIGPAHPLRGGLATFDHRLAKALQAEGFDAMIYSFSLQYPGLFFPGTTQYTTDPAPEGIQILSRINAINPLNWIRVGRELKRLQPDIILVRYWLPFMGPALGTIVGTAAKNGKSKIIAITDNILPHEKRFGDRAFTAYFLKRCDAFLTMSAKVLGDLRQFEKDKPAMQVLHPLYDSFGEPLPKDEARAFCRDQLGIDIGEGQKMVLFFGFIRKYKGLDILLEAMADPRIQAANIKLLVAGEFYEGRATYEQQIDRLGIRQSLILKTDFIPDAEVKYLLSAADAVIQPYRNATQSGVTPLAYHFEKPMVVTNVGGLPDLVPDGQAGLVSAPDPRAIADAILRIYQLGDQQFIPHLRREKEKYSWKALVESIIAIAHDIQK